MSRPGPAGRRLGAIARVGLAYWMLCIALGLLEALVGENVLSSLGFLLSIPALVGILIFVDRHALRTRQRLEALVTVGLSVLVYASLIITVGVLLASSVLKLAA